MNRRKIEIKATLGSVLLLATPLSLAGPYSAALNDSASVHDAPIPGFTGPHGLGKARLDDGTGEFQNPGNRVNPLFFAWASEYRDYLRSDADTGFSEPEYALGPVTGDSFDVVSLGDLTVGQITAGQITAGNQPGTITLKFQKPIKNLSGADFAVFENGFISTNNTGGAGVGGIFAELAYVEVSADGVNFRRFNPASLTPSVVGGYGSINPTNVYNLAGKHLNAYGDSWGTPFDIAQTGLTEISYIRLVDIPGNGAFKDSSGNSIFDSWRTIGSGGFDLEAIGSISTAMTFAEWPLLLQLPAGSRGPMDDPDQDGIPNLLEYAFGLFPWEKNQPGSEWQQGLIKEGASSFMEITAMRDERLMDLTREVQVSEDLSQWETIARSISGAAFQAVGTFQPIITDTRKYDIASVGVFREDRIRDTRPTDASAKRFYRIRVSRN